MTEVSIITSGMKPIKGEINVCLHCGEQAPYRGKFCGNCKTAKGRQERDEENKEIEDGRKIEN